MSEKINLFNQKYFNKTFLLIRVMMALLFLVAGAGKLTAIEKSVNYFASLNIPFPEIIIYPVILFEIGSGFLLISGWRLKFVAYSMAAFTVFATLAAHQFWIADSAHFGAQVTQFFKNISIIAGFVLIANFKSNEN